MSDTLCRHCHAEVATRARGLGNRCYNRIEIRHQYDVGPSARCGTGNFTGVRPQPPTPTDTEPGSDGRIAVLADRAANGFALFHPNDTRVDIHGFCEV